jgi:hypothetical protein
MSFSAPGPRPADAPGCCSLDLGFKIKNGIQNFQQHVAARFREPSASCTFPSHGRWLPVSSVVSSRPLAQMIIGIRCRRSSRNPRKDTTNHVSKCRVSGRESIFDLRITLVITTPRRTRSQETEMGRRAPARRRRSGARTPALVPLPKKKSPHSSSRAPRDAPDRGRACACLRRPPTLALSLPHPPSPRVSAVGARKERQRSCSGSDAGEVGMCVCSALFGRSSQLSIY